jgi:hypothetical protein
MVADCLGLVSGRLVVVVRCALFAVRRAPLSVYVLLMARSEM